MLPLLPPSNDPKVVRAAVHPAIGIARVGNSQNEFFIGPEITDPLPAPAGFYKDSTGAMKRQAARFRVYGLNAGGQVVCELTPDVADVSWTAHIVNAKAAWYQFQLAMDIPEAHSAPPSLLRNSGVQDRSTLRIDPGLRSIAGVNQCGAGFEFDSGMFLNTKVYLGELRTDDKGRLLVLGGRGVSGSPANAPLPDFANNDGWFDDTSDGPVTAAVHINGQAIPVDPAWVVVAPPNYGPNIRSARTMYDLMFDNFVREGWLPFPEKVSFARHIYPMFRRLVELQWVNRGFAVQFGWGGRSHFYEPGFMEKLASPDPALEEFRRQVANAFRRQDRDGVSPIGWPWIYGDSVALPATDSPRQFTALTESQLRMLDLWADGQFEADFDSIAAEPRSLDDVPLAEQPSALDEAALTFCLADAFHPGCEMTWVVRHTSMFRTPFRVRHSVPGSVEPSYGSQLTPETAVSLGGPLGPQRAGTVTRWQAVPWQADAASCRYGYYLGYGPKYDPFLPAFWPARVPNQVLTEEDYEKAMDASLPKDERLKAFHSRANWFRTLGDKDVVQAMVAGFGKMGVVEMRPGAENDPDLPSAMQVESKPGLIGNGRPPGAHVASVLVHVPEAANEAAAPGAIAQAIAHVGHPAERVLAGFVSKLHRFPKGLLKR